MRNCEVCDSFMDYIDNHDEKYWLCPQCGECITEDDIAIIEAINEEEDNTDYTCPDCGNILERIGSDELICRHCQTIAECDDY